MPATSWRLTLGPAQRLDEQRRSDLVVRVLDRGEGGDRVTTRADITLSSKRLGEFEPDRETADLLTADRLLVESDCHDADEAPALVREACANLAELRGWTAEETARRTHANAREVCDRRGWSVNDGVS